LDLIIRDGLLVTMSDKYGVIPHGAVCIEGNEIKAIGKSDEITRQFSAEEVIDAGGMGVLPGLINTHSHLYQSFLRGRADEIPLVEWCEKVLYPFCRMALEEALKGEEELAYFSSLLSCVEALKSGTTTIVAMDSIIQGPTVIQALLDSGIRGIYAFQMADGWIREDIILPTKWLLKRAENLLLSYKECRGGRIDFMMGPSAPFNCSKELLNGCKELAEEHGTGIQIHVAETRYEIEFMKKNFGMSSLEYLDSLKLLENDPFVAVHCVWLDKRELELLLRKGGGVSHNPESNMKLASGVAPIPEMLRRGIPVGLGTDGPASNDNMDMFEEMRTAALLHKVSTSDPSSISASDVLKMATNLGAKVLGIDDKVGSIEPGKRADIILVDLMKPHIQPLSDIFKTLVYCAKGSDVNTVIVNGNVVVRDGELLTLDEEDLLRRVTRIFEEKLSRLAEFREPRNPVKESDLRSLLI